MEKVKDGINKVYQFFNQNLRWILLAVCVIVLICIIENIFDQEIQAFDNGVYDIIFNSISEPVTRFMKIITAFGSAGVFGVISILILACYKNKKYAIYSFLNLVIITCLNLLLKNIFDRQRPEGYRLIEERGYSFPSGHSMISMAFYGLLIYFIWKKVKNPYLKWTSCIGLLLLILFIGISRIYLGVHYASDVIGGFCFSLAYLACYTHFIKGLLKEK